MSTSSVRLSAIKEYEKPLRAVSAARGRLRGQFTGPALNLRIIGTTSLAELLAGHGLVPATAGLYYFARWITPKLSPRRFDTRFLVGRMPAGQDPVVDGTETESCEWLAPRAALDRYLEGGIDLIPPTVRTLDDLARFPSIDAVLLDASRRLIRAASPDIEQVNGQPSMTYADNTGVASVPPRRLVLRDGRWRPVVRSGR